MKVAVTGSSGLIGTRLVAALRTDGHEVLRLVRRTPRTADEHRWDPQHRRIDPALLAEVDAVVNLAGTPIRPRPWTRRRPTPPRPAAAEESAAGPREDLGGYADASGPRVVCHRSLTRRPAQRPHPREDTARVRHITQSVDNPPFRPDRRLRPGRPAVSGQPRHHPYRHARRITTQAMPLSREHHQLGGALSLDWRSTGLVCEIEVPLRRVPGTAVAGATADAAA